MYRLSFRDNFMLRKYNESTNLNLSLFSLLSLSLSLSILFFVLDEGHQLINRANFELPETGGVTKVSPTASLPRADPGNVILTKVLYN